MSAGNRAMAGPQQALWHRPQSRPFNALLSRMAHAQLASRTTALLARTFGCAGLAEYSRPQHVLLGHTAPLPAPHCATV